MSNELFNPIIHGLNNEDEEKEKTCRTCGVPKSLKDFYSQKTIVKKRYPYTMYKSDCKECFKKKAVEVTKRKRLSLKQLSK